MRSLRGLDKQQKKHSLILYFPPKNCNHLTIGWNCAHPFLGEKRKEQKMELEWFKFHRNWSYGLYELSDAEAGRFTKAICQYIDTGEIQALSGNERILFSMAVMQLKQDAEHVARISSVRAEARRGKGARQKEMISNDNNSYQMKTNDIKNNKSSIKKEEIRIKNTEEDLNIICAEAQENQDSAPKDTNLTPDDSNYWKFAKENAELAETFYKTTGIHPVKSQFGRWVKDLRDLAEAGISAEQLRKTINYMQSEGIPLSAPGSCLKTAQWLKSRGSVPVRSQSKQKPTYNAFEQLAMQMNGIPEPSWDVEL